MSAQERENRKSWFQRLLKLFKRPGRRQEREALRLLRDLFARPELLQGTSLKPKHRSRAVYVRHEVRADHIATIRFGIIRHPRPYAFSKQVHEVAEFWDYLVEEDKLVRAGGLNLSRRSGGDGEPGGIGPGV